MKGLLTKAKEGMLLYWIVICYVVLFSLSALSTAILSSLIGASWSGMDTQGHVMIGLAVFTNWATVMIAFFNRAASRLSSGVLPISPDDVQLLQKTTAQTQTTVVSKTP